MGLLDVKDRCRIKRIFLIKEKKMFLAPLLEAKMVWSKKMDF